MSVCALMWVFPWVRYVEQQETLQVVMAVLSYPADVMFKQAMLGI